ncbi:glycosyltransferase family 39 protein [Glaciihabitans sp. UYNi722]|uniref:glycosyltransferase family 39 protein n=1 Tax=Glaciihabitans sp. UYNi722 TaxID=3156344 RepID=UPI003397F1C2
MHGTYYVIIHVWTGVFGDTEWATRSLSAFAVGAAAGGIVVIGRLLYDVRFGLLAAAIFSVLPRTTYMGSEARAYALATALVVWCVAVMILASRSSGSGWWALYAGLLVLGTYVFLYSILMAAVHLVYLACLDSRKRSVGRCILAFGATAILVSPLLLVARGQREQISWLADQPSVNVWTIVIEPWFDSSWLVAALVIGGLVVGVVRRRRLISLFDREKLILVVGWVILPLILLLLANGVAGPLYSSRYLSFTTPGLALALAMAIIGMDLRRWVAPVVVVGLVSACAPTYLDQRTPYAKNGGSDIRQVSETIATHASQGDAFYLQNDGPATKRPRLALDAYPQAFRSLDDVAFIRSDLTLGKYPDITRLPSQIQWSKLPARTVWVALVATEHPKSAHDIRKALTAAGYHIGRSFHLARTTVVEFDRDGAQ